MPLGPAAAPISSPTSVQPGYAPPGPPPAPRRLILILGALLGIALLGTAAAAMALTLTRHAQPPAPAVSAQTFTVYGELVLADSPGVLNLDDHYCTGMRGYDDIRAGTQVTVTDQASTVLAFAPLDQGTLIGSGLTRQCKFTFTIAGVPAGKSAYGVSVSHRGTEHYTETQLRDTVALSLGG